VSVEPESGDPSGTGNREGVKRARRSRKIKAKPGVIVAVIVAFIGAAGAIGAAAVDGAFANSSPSSTPPPIPAKSNAQVCSVFRADASIPPQVGPYAVLTVDFECAPAAGQQYMWVVEAKNIGINQHSEFYPQPFTSGVHVGIPFNHTIDFSKDTIGEQNCFYVISVTDAEYDAIESNLTPDGYTLHLPAGVNIVSATACESRVK
jgi:hypothetical protein